MVRLLFLGQLHRQVAVVVRVIILPPVGQVDLVAEVVVVVLAVRGRAVLEQQIKATQVAAEQPITQTGGQVVAVAVLDRLGQIP
jgi:hypothetical protein